MMLRMDCFDVLVNASFSFSNFLKCAIGSDN